MPQHGGIRPGREARALSKLASLRDYVLVAQDRRRIEVFSRSDGGEWQHRVFSAGDEVALPSIDCRFDLNELYGSAGV